MFVLSFHLFAHAVELTTFWRRWLTHTVYEAKGMSPYITMVAFHWVRVRVYILERVCQPFSRKSGKVPSAHVFICFSISSFV